ncbi:MAG: glucosaminidase domain-containing protein [Clostridia bacterium]
MSKKLIAVLLAVMLLLPIACIPSQAATSAEIQSFLNIICPLAAEKMPQTGILASLTISQAILESGYGTSGMARNYNNLFGLKAYRASWTGKVYCRSNKAVYSNFDEAISILGNELYKQYYNEFFRVFNSWSESLDSYLSLFLNNDRYANLRGLTDYKLAAKYVVEDGYCSDDGYTAHLINYIETHELYKYDSIPSDGTSVSSVVLNTSALSMKIGENYQLRPAVYPVTATNKTITYTSSNAGVASVDANGFIKAISAGTAVITAASANNIKATVSVYVSKNGEIMHNGTITKDVYCRAVMSNSTANNQGVFSADTKIIVYGEVKDDTWYYVSGKNRNNTVVYGYVYKSCIKLGDIYVEPDDTPKYTASVCKEVYCRAEKSDSKLNNLGIFAYGTPLIIFSELEDGFYYAKGRNKDGKEVSGWVYADALKITENIPTPEPPPDFSGGSTDSMFAFATTLSTLNCRKGPATSYASVGSFAKGTPIIICGSGITGSNIDGTWYFVKGISENGTPISGYSGGDYIKVGKNALSSTVSGGITLDINTDSGYIFGIRDTMTTAEIAAMYPLFEVKILSATGAPLSATDYVGTNCTLEISYKGQLLFSKAIVVLGDINGDGKINTSDYIRIRRHILSIATITECALSAADSDKNKKIDATDYIRVRMHILGVKNLFE